jgi:hypothetical protein
MEAKWAMQQKEALKKISGKLQAKLYVPNTIKTQMIRLDFLLSTF